MRALPGGHRQHRGAGAGAAKPQHRPDLPVSTAHQGRSLSACALLPLSLQIALVSASLAVEINYAWLRSATEPRRSPSAEDLGCIAWPSSSALHQQQQQSQASPAAAMLCSCTQLRVRLRCPGGRSHTWARLGDQKMEEESSHVSQHLHLCHPLLPLLT